MYTNRAGEDQWRAGPDLSRQHPEGGGVMRLHVLPCKGRWQAEGLTEGCRALDTGSPLHHALMGAVPPPLEGRNW